MTACHFGLLPFPPLCGPSPLGQSNDGLLSVAVVQKVYRTRTRQPKLPVSLPINVPGSDCTPAIRFSN